MKRLGLVFAWLFVALPAAQAQVHSAVVLRIAGDEWFLKSLTETQLLSGFEQKHHIHVRVIFKNDRAIMGDLDSTSAAYDIIVVRHRLLGKLVRQRKVQSIDPFLRSAASRKSSFDPRKQLFQDWWRELSSYDGRYYGLPYTALTTYFCYRKDLFGDLANRQAFYNRFHRELQPPATWEEFLKLAEFFNRPADHFYGTYIQGKKGLALWYEWLNLIYSFGGNILDSPHGSDYGDIVVNSPQNIAATEQYLRAIPFSPPDTLNFGWNEAQETVQQGHVAMGLLWNDQVPFLEDSRVSKVAGRIGYALVPSASKPFAQLEGLTYLIVSGSKRTREAYNFLEWAMSQQVQEAQTSHGGSSLRRSTYDNFAISKLPYTPAFRASIPIAVGKPTVPESDMMTQAAVERLSDVVVGKSSPKEGLDALALDLKRILGEKSRMRYRVNDSPAHIH